jgi:hypothetical protein
VQQHGKNHGGVGMSVSVVVRKRPVFDEREDVMLVLSPMVTVYEQKVKVDLTKYVDEQHFTYDDAYGEGDSTDVLYQRSVHELVGNMFQGGTSTAFCFGQTASGKTFTLFGAEGGQSIHESLVGAGAESEAARGGVYLLAAYDIFQTAEALKASDPGSKYTVALSMYEIKGQRLYDLMNDREEITALEDGNGVLQLVGLTQHGCMNLGAFLELGNIGRTARSTAATGANETSSRSHCTMLIRIYKEDALLGKLSLIDLAGSERGADNENTDVTTRMEGRDINRSLLALKEVIRALQSGKHAPFRQSRLTQVLEESLTGQHCRTVVIACVSGSEHDTHHTMNTLRYAHELRPNAGKLKKATTKLMAVRKLTASKSKPSLSGANGPEVARRGSFFGKSSRAAAMETPGSPFSPGALGPGIPAPPDSPPTPPQPEAGTRKKGVLQMMSPVARLRKFGRTSFSIDAGNSFDVGLSPGRSGLSPGGLLSAQLELEVNLP